MSEFFLKIFNMSISASWIILAVIVLRLLLKKAPKWINVLLWGIVAVRLICPLTFESEMSLIPSTETIPTQTLTSTPQINTGIPTINSTLNPVIQESTISVSPTESVNVLQLLISIISKVWIIGIALMLTYSVICYIRIRKKIGTAVLLRDNIYQSETVASPFVLGIIFPTIYLPFSISEQDIESVIAHEQAHIKRKDYIWKPLGFLLLTLHWFNPLVWFGYILLCRDIELACDEKAIKHMNIEQRADYSQALLACSVNRRTIAACPVAFGEVDVKNRIISVLNYKKPTFWIILIAIISSIVIAACFLTNPVNTSEWVLDKLFNSDTYEVIEQENKVISLSFSTSDLPDNIYTKEGAKFKDNEIIAYKNATTTIFLKEAKLQYEEYNVLSLSFEFTYDLPKNQGTLLHHFGIEQNGEVSYHFPFPDGTLKNEDREYINAIDLQGEDFYGLSFYVSADALKKCEGTVSFDITLNEITYCLDADDYISKTNNNNSMENSTSDEFSSDVNLSYDINMLREKYPMYFDIDTSNGLTVYVWQMSATSYYCGLLANTNDGYTDLDFLRLKAATLDEMRYIVASYLPYMFEDNISICPIVMPTSSYAYTIDEKYIAEINELFWNEFLLEESLLYGDYPDSAIFDIDGDGINEECIIGPGPTSGIYSFEISVFENGELEYFGIFSSLEIGNVMFAKNEDGKIILITRKYEPYDTSICFIDIAIVDGNLALYSDEIEFTIWE